MELKKAKKTTPLGGVSSFFNTILNYLRRPLLTLAIDTVSLRGKKRQKKSIENIKKACLFHYLGIFCNQPKPQKSNTKGASFYYVF